MKAKIFNRFSKILNIFHYNLHTPLSCILYSICQVFSSYSATIYSIHFIFLQDKRKDIENFVGVKLKSMLCVPVSSRNNDGLIALACVVNKKDAEK